MANRSRRLHLRQAGLDVPAGCFNVMATGPAQRPGGLVQSETIINVVRAASARVIAGLDFGLGHSGITLTWFAVLVAVNLQTSFLTPPFGYALFYLRGIAPPDLSISQIYRGVIPFVLIQMAGLGLCILFPSLVLWLPDIVSN